MNPLKNKSLNKKQFFQKTEFLRTLQTVSHSEKSFKEKMYLIAGELGNFLNSSRCQIKFFSQSSPSRYDFSLSSEYSVQPYIEAISIIPKFEEPWINALRDGRISLLINNQIPSILNIEIVLSIKSILGVPIVYKDKAVGVITIHQCDYERTWEEEEIVFVNEIAFIISLLWNKETELREEKNNVNKNILTSDEFLREINHIQIEAQINNLPFSLIMLDIEKLKEINLNKGFVAGTLVLNQLSNFLSRFFADRAIIARYNNDEFVLIFKNTDQNKALILTNELKEKLSNFSVLGVGTIDFNFSYVTFPTHSTSIQELFSFLEQGMILSKSRGRFQISSIAEVKGQPKEQWDKLLTYAVPEIIFKKSNFKTGPEVLEAINKQIDERKEKRTYSINILDSIQSLALALDAKDSYTEGHSNRVSEYAYMLAKQISLDLQEIEWIRLAAAMHDIGKIGIPENILCKEGKLTKEEYEVMKKHPLIGAKILKPIKPLEQVANLVLYHHEFWDGKGYPNSLKKEEIPIGARIISIVDAFQAMTSNRPYRSALPFEEGIKRLKDGKEKQWDPALIDQFIELIT